MKNMRTVGKKMNNKGVREKCTETEKNKGFILLLSSGCGGDF